MMHNQGLIVQVNRSTNAPLTCEDESVTVSRWATKIQNSWWLERYREASKTTMALLNAVPPLV